jgi:dihydrofolate synthase / folylpolyglutamate synthase
MQLHSYTGTLNWLYSQLPVFHRDGAKAYKADLSNTLLLDSKLGSPHLRFKTIHIAGTNGKGSVSHTVASVLNEAGYKTGLYTSPHLKDFSERIVIGGKPICRNYVCEFVNSYMELIKEVRPSFFEITVAMAFSYFADEGTDCAVIETGLGGRLDSTNIITPIACAITNISLDHADLLGDTIGAIAYEKAGIIKAGVPVCIGRKSAETDSVFTSKAESTGSPLVFAEDQMQLIASTESPGSRKLVYSGPACRPIELRTPLLGICQEENMRTVYILCELLNKAGLAVSHNNVADGILNIQRNFPLRGRWEILSEQPLVIADTAHNIDGVAQVCRQLEAIDNDEKHIIWGMLGDKDVDAAVSLLPKDARYYISAPNNMRAMPAEKLATVFMSHRLDYCLYPNLQSALENAKKNCSPNGLIFIGGSTFTVAELI